MDKILQYSIEKIKKVPLLYKRQLYDKLVKIDENIVWIVWLRGIWKTTLLLQLANNHLGESVYFSMDSTFVKSKSIFEIVEELYKNYSMKYFFIDEIHKYNNWQQDLKTIYDFFDDVKIYFSWSSNIDLIKWNYDLSRRWLLFKLNKFSFREYLFLKYNIDFEVLTIDNILSDYKNISLNFYSKYNNILEKFWEYLIYWELWFRINSQQDYYGDKLLNILNKIIYEDITNFYNLKTENIYYFFEILKFIANSSPSDVNYLSIAKNLSTTPDTIKSYINILNEIWFLNILWKEWKVSINLRKSKKIFFELTNFIDLFSDKINTDNLLWIRRESFVVSELLKIWKLYYNENVDLVFIIENKKYYFEIWWKNKKLKQIKSIENSFLIKDWIEIWTDLQIPIYLFWFLY